jgi:hypothetical protein
MPQFESCPADYADVRRDFVWKLHHLGDPKLSQFYRNINFELEAVSSPPQEG